jgi:hypothetical protein
VGPGTAEGTAYTAATAEGKADKPPPMLVR